MAIFSEATDARANDEHWDLERSGCKVTRGFQLIRRVTSGSQSLYASFSPDDDAPVTYTFRCPVGHAFKQWILYDLKFNVNKSGYITRYFRVTSAPNDGSEEIVELPEDPPSLRTAYRQAIRAMDANANLAAAAIFRRALQIVTRDLLGAKPANLAKELREVVDTQYNGGTVTANFADIGYIVK